MSLDEERFFLSQLLPTIEESLKIAIAAFFGAYLARVPFVLTTIVYYTGISIYIFYILTLIAEPVQTVTMFEVAARNSVGVAFGLAAAVLGAEIGSRLSYGKSNGLAEAV